MSIIFTRTYREHTINVWKKRKTAKPQKRLNRAEG